MLDEVVYEQFAVRIHAALESPRHVRSPSDDILYLSARGGAWGSPRALPPGGGENKATGDAFALCGWDDLVQDPSWKVIAGSSPIIPRPAQRLWQRGRSRRQLSPLNGGGSCQSSRSHETSTFSLAPESDCGAGRPPSTAPQSARDRDLGRGLGLGLLASPRLRGKYHVSGPLLLPDVLGLKPRAPREDSDAERRAREEADDVKQRVLEEAEHVRIAEMEKPAAAAPRGRRQAHVRMSTVHAPGEGFARRQSSGGGLDELYANPLAILKRSVQGKAATPERGKQEHVGMPLAEIADSDEEDDEDDDDSGDESNDRDKGRRHGLRTGSKASTKSTGTPRVQPKLLLQVRKEKEDEEQAKEHTLGKLAEKSTIANNSLNLRHRLALGLEHQARRNSEMLEGTGRASSKETMSTPSVLDPVSPNVISGAPRVSILPELSALGRLPQRHSAFLVTVPVLVKRQFRLKNKDKRMDRLKKLATLNRSRSMKVNFHLKDRDRTHFEEVFKRYDYDRSGDLDLAEVHDALADLGLRPVERKDKTDLKQLIDASGGSLDFLQFCKMVHDRRHATDEGQQSKLRKLFSQYDFDDSGTLSVDELLNVFAALHLSPERDDERMAFLEAVMDADVDGSGVIEWEEFEMLVTSVKQKVAQCRREREIRICQQMRLPTEMFLSFRSDLIVLQEGFRMHDVTGQGTMRRDDVPHLLLARGFARSLKQATDYCECDEAIMSLTHGREAVDFTLLLHIVARVREINEGSRSGDLRTVFDMYDKDGEGHIAEDDVRAILRDLAILTNIEEEHNDVQRVIAHCDTDGNGTIEFEEFEMLVEHINELQRRHLRDQERSHATKLGFSDNETCELREIFAMLDSKQDGNLSFQDVAKALELVGKPDLDEQLLRKYDTEKNGRLDFKNFLVVMNDLMPRKPETTVAEQPNVTHRGSVETMQIQIPF